MNEGNKKTYFIETLLLIFIIFYIFIFSSFINLIRYVVIGLFLVCLILLSLKLLGYKKDNAFDKETAIKLEISVFIGMFFIYFLLGLLLGFGKTPFATNKEMILIGFYPALIFSILIEILRFVLFKGNNLNKKHIKIITALLVVFNVLIETNLYMIGNNYLLFIWLSIIVIPIIAQELLCSYLTYNFGFLPSLIFRLFIKLHIYLLPIFPNLSDYLYGVLNIIIPYIIYIITRKYIIKIDRLSRRRGRENRFVISFISIPLVVLLVTVVSLVSGLFNHQLIAIASGSMEPTYYKGDAILVTKKIDDELSAGDILVYYRNDLIVAHRLVKIINHNGEKYYYTKGDANPTDDDYFIKREDIVGKVEYVVKYIGLPTIYMSELFRKR